MIGICGPEPVNKVKGSGLEFFQSHVTRNERKREEEMRLDMMSNSGNTKESMETTPKRPSRREICTGT
jgi:hypothetical protein